MKIDENHMNATFPGYSVTIAASLNMRMNLTEYVYPLWDTSHRDYFTMITRDYKRYLHYSMWSMG